jgi:hypothetical protein
MISLFSKDIYSQRPKPMDFYYFFLKKNPTFILPLKPELFSYTIYLTLKKVAPIPNSLSIQISP